MSVGDMIEIGSCSTIETRKIASIATPPQPEENPLQFRFGRRSAPGGTTTIWQPLPEGPIITIPAGSNNIPVTDISSYLFCLGIYVWELTNKLFLADFIMLRTGIKARQ